ncbi:MAG: helix-turn-helix transcriptional regulator [Planctomycetota bacterium]
MARKRLRVRNPKTRHAEIVNLFAGKLRELRRSRGLSQQELAQRAEISVPYAGRLERAEAAPGIDLVERLATALEVPVADLLPTTTPDPVAFLRRQAERRFQSVMSRADRATLMMLNPWLAVLDDALARGR